MNLREVMTVRELAVEVPGATRVLEKLGIDYCCGGSKPIGEACQAAGVTVAEVARSLEDFSSQAAVESKDPQAESLASLASYIISKHHRFTRDELDGIEPLLEKVCSVYGERRPELPQIQALLRELKNELLPHMLKEENILFPYIAQMEDAITAGLAAPVPMFGTVRNPVRMMMFEHDAAGDLLRRIQQLSDQFTPPADACLSYQTLYRRIGELTTDLQQHIHLENNILFPRAIEMEG
jgi:regulator of cell morphogenesis and NO signaling